MKFIMRSKNLATGEVIYEKEISMDSLIKLIPSSEVVNLSIGEKYSVNGTRMEIDTHVEVVSDTEEKDIPNIVQSDPINQPSHYTQGKVECIDAIESATVGKSGIEAICVGNVIKYLWRYEQKGGKESVEKAKWYLDKLLDSMG